MLKSLCKPLRYFIVRVCVCVCWSVWQAVPLKYIENQSTTYVSVLRHLWMLFWPCSQTWCQKVDCLWVHQNDKLISHVQRCFLSCLLFFSCFLDPQCLKRIAHLPVTPVMNNRLICSRCSLFAVHFLAPQHHYTECAAFRQCCCNQTKEFCRRTDAHSFTYFQHWIVSSVLFPQWHVFN